MKLGRLPVAPAPPMAMIEISARPAWRLYRKLPQLREQAEEATPTLFLQCMSPQMGMQGSMKPMDDRMERKRHDMTRASVARSGRVQPYNEGRLLRFAPEPLTKKRVI
jgi:hypothetical protein